MPTLEQWQSALSAAVFETGHAGLHIPQVPKRVLIDGVPLTAFVRESLGFKSLNELAQATPYLVVLSNGYRIKHLHHVAKDELTPEQMQQVIAIAMQRQTGSTEQRSIVPVAQPAPAPRQPQAPTVHIPLQQWMNELEAVVLEAGSAGLSVHKVRECVMIQGQRLTKEVCLSFGYNSATKVAQAVRSLRVLNNGNAIKHVSFVDAPAQQRAVATTAAAAVAAAVAAQRAPPAVAKSSPQQLTSSASAAAAVVAPQQKLDSSKAAVWCEQLAAAVHKAGPGGIIVQRVEHTVFVNREGLTKEVCMRFGYSSVTKLAQTHPQLRVVANGNIIMHTAYMAPRQLQQQQQQQQAAASPTTTPAVAAAAAVRAPRTQRAVPATAVQHVVPVEALEELLVQQQQPSVQQHTVSIGNGSTSSAASTQQQQQSPVAARRVTPSRQQQLLTPQTVDLLEASSTRHAVLQQVQHSSSSSGTNGSARDATVTLFDGSMQASGLVKQWGLLGALDYSSSKPVYMNTNEPFCMVAVGAQSSDKTHTVAAVVENCVLSHASIAQQHEPMAALILHYDSDPSNSCELAALTMPSREPQLAAATDNMAVKQLAVLVSPNYYIQREMYYSDNSAATVYPLLFEWSQLSAAQLVSLMRLDTTDNSSSSSSSSCLAVLDRLKQYQRADEMPTFAEFVELCESCDVDATSSVLRQRLSLLQSFIADSSVNELLRYERKSLEALIEDGALVIADLTDPMLAAEEANRIFQLLLQQFRTVRKSTLVVLSEAHKYMNSSISSSNSGLASELVHVARQLQQQNLRIVVSTQSPLVLPEELLELTTLAAVHSFQSPDWYKYLQSKFSMESALFSEVTALKSGQALVFARKTVVKGTQQQQQQQQQQQLWSRVQIRRRLTHDGMSTAVVPYISSSTSGSHSVQSSFPRQSPTTTVEAFSVGV
eukprot:21306-Heterococcus_DN1.PRE.2